MLDGDPGLGKSLITLDLAARVSSGREMPDGSRGALTAPARVVLLSAEDDPADAIRPRLNAAGADPALISMLTYVVGADGPRLPSLADIDTVRDAVLHTGARFVIIDPLMAYLPHGTNGILMPRCGGCWRR